MARVDWGERHVLAELPVPLADGRVLVPVAEHHRTPQGEPMFRWGCRHVQVVASLVGPQDQLIVTVMPPWEGGVVEQAFFDGKAVTRTMMEDRHGGATVLREVVGE